MTRWLWIQLGSLVALLALAAYFMTAPAPARPVKPTEIEAETARVRPTRPPEPEPLNTPPPAPDVVNDPARGAVVLRVIDAETFLPLTNRRCELCEVETKLGEKPQSEFFPRGIEPSAGEPRDFDATDDHGVLTFKAVTADSKVFFNRVKFAPKLGWKYPVPPGYEPVSHPDALAATIAALKNQPTAKPVDVLVRAAPRVHGRVWDPEGRPAADAEVFAWPFEVALELKAWALCLSEHFEEVEESRKANPDQDVTEVVDVWLEMMLNDSDSPSKPMRKVQFGPGWDLSSIAGPFRAKTDRNGRYTLPAMFRGRWMICAWMKDTPHTARDCRLSAADHEIDFSMPAPPLPSLRVVIEFKGETLGKMQQSTDFLVCVESCSPCGTATWKDGSRHTLSVDPNQTMTADFTGLAPGFYTVCVWASINMGKRGGRWENGALVRVEAGALATVVVPLGPEHESIWLPTVTVDGKPLGVVSMLLQGGPHSRPELIGFTATGGRLEGRRLPAGTYTARMPGIGPQTFNFAADKPLSTNWNLKSSRTSFLIEPEFAASALKGAKEAKLQLYPLGDLRSVAVPMLAHVNDVGDMENFPLKAGEPCTVVLFPGEYQWILDAEDRGFQGTLTIPSEGTSAIRFGLAGLPGLHRINIDVKAWIKAGAAVPEIEIYTERSLPDRILAPSSTYERETGFSSNYFGPFEERAGHFVVFASPGVYRVSAGGKSALIAAPGQVELSPAEERGLVALSWTVKDREPKYVVTIAGAGGLPQTARDGAKLMLRPGRVTVRAIRNKFDNGDSEPKNFVAEREVNLTADTVLDLNTFPWVAYGSFTLTCEGRGSPGEPFDAWWWENDGWRNVEIVSWNRKSAFGPTEVVLADLDDWMPEGRMAFTFKNRSVPPGTYKVIPWPGAAEKYCRTFEVRSSKHTEVTVKGG